MVFFGQGQYVNLSIKMYMTSPRIMMTEEQNDDCVPTLNMIPSQRCTVTPLVAVNGPIIIFSLGDPIHHLTLISSMYSVRDG